MTLGDATGIEEGEMDTGFGGERPLEKPSLNRSFIKMDK
jgi:hypothetical protein